MIAPVIITFCVLLLMAYVFDLTSSKTRVPSVILLLILGWAVRQLTYYFEVSLPNLSSALPLLGTVGLILIVLEGSLELEFNRSKLGLIRKSFLGALGAMAILAVLLAWWLSSDGQYSFKDGLINALPLCVISSAIAIPSVRNLSSQNKEFVIYESSLSDILGVLIFNFLLLNEIINGASFGNFALQLVVMLIVSFVATIGLSFLLHKVDHHIKFIPIIIMVILIYAISKIYHLPGLIFIMLFGLFIGNLDELKHFKWIERFNPEALDREVKKFKEITIEAAFLIRTVFFLLFGYLIETADIINLDILAWAGGIVLLIFVIRAIQLKISKLPLRPLLFVAPRGLITILLFLSIEPMQQIGIVNKSLVIQVIILTSLLMMFGLIISKKKE